MKTMVDCLCSVQDWFFSEFMRHSETALEMLVIGMNLLYDGRY